MRPLTSLAVVVSSLPTGQTGDLSLVRAEEVAVVVVAGAAVVGALVTEVVVVAGDADGEVQLSFGSRADLVGLE